MQGERAAGDRGNHQPDELLDPGDPSGCLLGLQVSWWKPRGAPWVRENRQLKPILPDAYRRQQLGLYGLWWGIVITNCFQVSHTGGPPLVRQHQQQGRPVKAPAAIICLAPAPAGDRDGGHCPEVQLSARGSQGRRSLTGAPPPSRRPRLRCRWGWRRRQQRPEGAPAGREAGAGAASTIGRCIGGCGTRACIQLTSCNAASARACSWC